MCPQYEHSGIDTNNYLESWHQKLKRNYIKKRNLNMPEVIAMLLHEVRLSTIRGAGAELTLTRCLLRKILPMFRFAHLRITLKFARASLTAAERKNRHSAMHYSNTDMALCVNIQEREHKVSSLRHALALRTDRRNITHRYTSARCSNPPSTTRSHTKINPAPWG